MPDRPHPRPAWGDLPAGLQHAVEGLLGSRVLRAESRPFGMSAGTADRVTTADGGRAFVKTADQPETAAMHRREAAVLAELDGRASAPRLVGLAEVDGRVALVTECIDGEHPALPRGRAALAAALDVVARFGRPVSGSAPLAAELRDAAARWADVPGSAAGWTARVAALAAGASAASVGGDLVHGDLRIDNLLVEQNGRPRIVDWAWAAVGARWVDGFTLLLDARRLGSRDADALIAAHPLFAAVEPGAVDAVLAAFAGYFLSAAEQPAPERMPALRPFQRAQGDATLAWLADRRPDLGIPPRRASASRPADGARRG